MQKFFDKDWLTYSVEFDPKSGTSHSLIWKMDGSVQAEPGTGWRGISRMIFGISQMDLGTNPYVSLSGGVDSQAVCLLMKKAGRKFKIGIMEYENGFNDMDVEAAINFCNKHKFEYTLFKFDVIQFLTRDLSQYVERYECPSPQFCVHFKFYEMLIEQGATSILAGGNAPYFYQDHITYPTTRSQNAWTIFAKKNDFKLYGNVLGWSADIAIPLIVSSPNVLDYHDVEAGRYASKVKGMHNLGLYVMPQNVKYTGFEKIKKFFSDQTGDELFFDKSFRYLNFSKYPDYQGFLIPTKLEEDIKLSSFQTLEM